MAQIPSSAARPGMMIEEPVTIAPGSILIDRGVVLTDEHIGTLCRLKVATITVKDGTDTARNQEASFGVAPRTDDPNHEAKETIELRFQRFEQNEAMQAIKRAAEKLLLKPGPPPQP